MNDTERELPTAENSRMQEGRRLMQLLRQMPQEKLGGVLLVVEGAALMCTQEKRRLIRRRR